MTEGSVVPASKLAAVAMPAVVRSVHVTDDVESLRLTVSGAACEEVEGEGVELGPSAGCLNPATVADAAAVGAPYQVGNDVMGMVEAMTEKLKTKN